jgi:hypothetical protein
MLTRILRTVAKIGCFTLQEYPDWHWERYGEEVGGGVD